ncbi:hypothetical protein [Desulforhopalus singaporensis]|uniref:DUF4412 domain-containing protein n=1 Tax=Desulforhopalus singaporensis TaxID=91360 RepID=A0A1H0R196_9BACT|nr:hypothetical protein [Desulforhopalus singaporensis]SDP22778.1 hypothetical protein SAMN05660330_02150 [Desulforhopalus singaporensis]
MLRLMIVSLLVAVFGVAEGFAGESLPWEKKLPYKELTVVYKISGLENGKETLYLRDYGRQRATYRETVTKMMGTTVKDRTIEFVTPDYIYTYDLQAHEGVQGVNPQKYMVEEYEKLSPADKDKVLSNAEKAGVAAGTMVGAKVEENALVILGYDCDKVTVMGGSVSYIMHGTDIVLKSEVAMMGMKMVSEAVSLEEKVTDASVFNHPPGITAVADPDAEQVGRSMAIQSIEVLKDPEKMTMFQEKTGEEGAVKKQMQDAQKQIMEQAGEMLKGIQNMFGE